MCTTARGEYQRRGSPLDKTRWTISRVHEFIRWQMRERAAGRAEPDIIGGFAYKLPSAGADGQPAPLPEGAKDAPTAADDQSQKAESIDDEIGYFLCPTIVDSVPQHVLEDTVGRKMTLEALPAGQSYWYYMSPEGACIYDGKTARFCIDLLDEAYIAPFGPTMPATLGSSSGSELLPGMKLVPQGPTSVLC
jgi:hypothetical protein